MSDTFHRLSGIGASHAKLARAINLPRAGCTNGLYTAPTSGGTYDSLNKLTVSWDTTCFDPAPNTVDIKLTAPLANKTAIHTFKGALYSQGTIDLDLLPRWWNSTSTISLQVTVINDSELSFLSDQVAGPIFTVTYDATKAATQTGAADAANTGISDEPYSSVGNDYKSGGLSKGALAAAILIPLLIVIGAVTAYVIYSRKKEKEKRKRWSEKVDQRMSYISGDWRSMSGSAANAAIRQSMAASGGRVSSFFASNGPQPRASMASDYPNQAGVGSKWMTEQDMTGVLRRPQLASTNPAARISTVSFANDPRPSGDRGTSIYDRQSMFSTYGNGSSKNLHKDVPPVPRAAFAGQRQVDDMEMSPTQAEGAPTLSPDEIRSRIHNGHHDVDADVLPALALMRTGRPSEDQSGDYLVHSPTQIAYPDLPPTGETDLHAGMTSPPPPAMTPDDMLAAYAAQKRNNTGKSRKPSTPGAETTSLANGGMRVLYAPSTSSSEHGTPVTVHEDPYSGMEADPYAGYANNQYDNSQYGNNQYDNNQYGNNQYGNAQYAGNQGASLGTTHYSVAASYGSAYSTEDPFKQVERR